MAEKSNTKAMMALLSRPQMILLSSLALILLLAMVDGAFIYQRHFSVQQQTTQLYAEYDALYEIALLQKAHFQLAEAIHTGTYQHNEANYQQARAQIDQHLQALQEIYQAGDPHVEIQQQLPLYQQAWTNLQLRLTQARQQPQDATLERALRADLPPFEAELNKLLEASHLALTPHLGNWLVALQSMAPLLKSANGLLLLIALLTAYGFVQFIQERHRSEEATQASERRHRALLDTIPDVVLRRKRDGIYTDFKPANHFGRFMPSADFIGKHISQILPPAVVEVSMAASEKALATGEAQVYEYRMPNRLTGIMRDYEARVVPSGADEVQVIVRDITEDKLQEERIRQAQKLESLGVLAGGIAHDFNNLLTGMLGQTSLAKFKLTRGQSATEHIDKAITSAERASDLTRQLLAYAGKGNFQITALDLTQLIREITGLLETALPNRAALQLHLEDSLLPIEADRGQIQQVVMNLVINATEALPPEGGYVQIKTTNHFLTDEGDMSSSTGDKLLPGHYVMLQISDNGCGMDEKIRSRIFDPFFSTKSSGHGLGLSATLGIMRTHHGGIQVQSQLGIGTSFTLLFPAMPAARRTPVGAPERVEVAQVPSSYVLVVDDEATIRELAADILTAEGISVYLAASGMEGIEHFRQHPDQIALVLLDLKMPGLSGEDTLQALRQIDPQVNVILSSGYSETEVTNHFREGEIIAFLQKPYDVDLLLQHVHRVLARKTPA
jgi:signal transduction histidine kinase/ActR/RegA family two-component response regulator